MYKSLLLGNNGGAHNEGKNNKPKVVRAIITRQQSLPRYSSELRFPPLLIVEEIYVLRSKPRNSRLLAGNGFSINANA
jgi:hypothetical protein